MNKMQKRLAVFIPSFAGGGAEKSVLSLTHGMGERGYQVDLVVARAEGPYKDAVHPSARVVDLKACGVLASLPGLTRYLRREKPAALLSALNHANIVALWARSLAGVATRVIVSEHNTLSTWALVSSSLRNRMMPRLIQLFYPWTDAIVAVSCGVAEDLVETAKLPHTRVHVIYNPVVTPSMWEKSKARPSHPWFGPDQPPVVLAVGRLTPQKDFTTLIQAFARVLRTRPARLMILGEGPARHEMEELARKLKLEDNVALPGFVENPYSYMARANLFVLSSRWEGLPTVLIEALSCGTPVIATDCPSGPREILGGGQYGQLVPMRNAPSLAGAILAALDGKTPRPSPESWQPYELNRVVDQYLQILFGLDSAAPSLKATA